VEVGSCAIQEGDVSAPDTSRLETFKDELIAAMEGITTANGYRTTMKEVSANYLDPSAKTNLPVCAVLTPQEEMRCKDVNRSLWVETVFAGCLVYCRPVDLDAAIQDVKRALVALAISHVNVANPWQLVGKPEDVILSIRNGIMARDLMWITVEFKAQLNNVTGTL
jgi:hypothetical protein